MPPRDVLLIEDNLDAAESFRLLIELIGHSVAVAHSGREGIEMAKAFGPATIMCDIGLPEMDGYEVARCIRNDPELRAVRLIALSGYTAPEDIAKAREAGFDAYLAKPASLDRLKDALGRIVA